MSSGQCFKCSTDYGDHPVVFYRGRRLGSASHTESSRDNSFHLTTTTTAFSDIEKLEWYICDRCKKDLRRASQIEGLIVSLSILLFLFGIAWFFAYHEISEARVVLKQEEAGEIRVDKGGNKVELNAFENRVKSGEIKSSLFWLTGFGRWGTNGSVQVTIDILFIILVPIAIVFLLPGLGFQNTLAKAAIASSEREVKGRVHWTPEEFMKLKSTS